MQAAVLHALRCPLCRAALEQRGATLRCPAGHTFDLARQGYVNLLSGRPASAGDDAAMVGARAALLEAGHHDPLAARLAELAAERAPAAGLVVDVGAGTGWYLARVLDQLPGRAGLGLDVSKYAARRAARAHERADAAVADTKARLPLADGAAALLLDVFAPRNGPEFRRVLRGDGLLVVVTPTAAHHAEIREALGLLAVDPAKERRLAAALAPDFEREPPRILRWALDLGPAELGHLVRMSPSAHHIPAAALEARIAALPAPLRITAEVRLDLCRPR